MNAFKGVCLFGILFCRPEEMFVSVLGHCLSSDYLYTLIPGTNRLTSLRVPTHIEKNKKVYFFHKTTLTYRCTFFLCYYLPKLSNNKYSLKF